jgi:hypothetical protein
MMLLVLRACAGQPDARCALALSDGSRRNPRPRLAAVVQRRAFFHISKSASLRDGG